MGPRASALGEPVVGCQKGTCQRRARLRRSISAIRGPHKDEGAEDAGPLEAQVTKLGCSGAATGLLPGLVLNGEDRGDTEPRLLAAEPLLELQLPGEDVWIPGSAGKLSAFGPQYSRGQG